ncbi:MAG: PHP domain-containing protein [Oliverpabstia sp.]
MKKIIADVHTHTLASGHAYGTIREMAQAAAEKKLEILGITEHAPRFDETLILNTEKEQLLKYLIG